MGWDLWTYPVRLDSPSMRMIRADPTAWQTAVDNPPFSYRRDDPSLPEAVVRLRAELPHGIEAWHWLDRTYGKAEFLLDPAGYRTVTSWEERERSLPYRIVEGDDEFAGHARGVQGIPWRCSTAKFLAEAASVIDAVDPVAARAEFSGAEMYELGVYKARPEGNDDEECELTLAALRRLAAYYHELAHRDVDLIVVKD